MGKAIGVAKNLVMIICLAIFLAMSILLILISTQRNSNEYRIDIEGIFYMSCTFYRDDTMLVEKIIDDRYESDRNCYIIKDSRLYIKDKNGDGWSFVGKINAFEIVTNSSSVINGEIVLKCDTAYIMRSVICMVMIVSVILFLGVLVFYIMGYIKDLEQEIENLKINTTEYR